MIMDNQHDTPQRGRSGDAVANTNNNIGLAVQEDPLLVLEDGEERLKYKEKRHIRRIRKAIPFLLLLLLCYLTAMLAILYYRKHQTMEEETCEAVPKNKTATEVVRDNFFDLVSALRANQHVSDLLQGASAPLFWKGQQHPPPEKEQEGVAARDATAATVGSSSRSNKQKYKPPAYPTSYTTKPVVTQQDVKQLQEFHDMVHAQIPNIRSRVSHVYWGGTQPWWTHSSSMPWHHKDIDGLDGGKILFSYLTIMRKYMKDGSLTENVNFPFKLCKQQPKRSCSVVDAIEHTLQFREQYQPWRVTPAMLTENPNGWVYAHGFSKPPPTRTKQQNHHDRHAMIWLRPGRHHVVDPLTYFRCILHTVEKALADSFHESHQRVGRFNILIDGTDFEWAKVPDMKYMKHTIHILQDHYPHRLGMLVLTNMSRTAEMVVALIKPLIAKGVREKIHVLSHDPERRMAELETFVETRYIPDWLGGTDKYQFDQHSYYSSRFSWSDKESLVYMETMPYHALT